MIFYKIVLEVIYCFIMLVVWWVMFTKYELKIWEIVKYIDCLLFFCVELNRKDELMKYGR